ncbi:type VI secretion system-associated protein TagO [Ignatzschineria cameli]|uniref:Type VI secretion system-associated protein TagO n=1 Tax=Ignatzschineria cameli TaxID=2182793 RepID=A0A2U2AQC7_9GAMM|nr:type VI secretion system-associated protein TagO [Ignatzschineria cameli]PWD85832.1 hypothetical protein DC077_07320 [Ignatzschineria cameli]PWD89460.1 hypothetical protein DC079_06945 [Ignatzschineria cameli]PWD90932.1 hypothetical protein DC081_06655 [Ignatzschineria cameli]PWD91720.1 hypothetical protein DC078_06940 [Ignatzschineria cameli]
MKKLFFSVALFSLSAAYASNCSSIENDIARLACYDKNAENSKNNENEQNESDKLKKEYDDWIVNITESPLDDSKEVTIIKFANDYKNKRSPAILMLRCQRDKTDAFVSWDEYLGSNNMKVAYRIDKEEAKNSWWNASSNGQASFIPKPISFIKSLEGKETIYIEAEKYRGGRVSATFDISGIKEVIEPLRKACNW